jgi:glycosyltransferase involved in cell wall biosynthesis
MKILVVQDHLRSGGTERQSVLLANAFAAAGHTTTLLTFRPGGALAPTVEARVSHRTLQPFDTRLDWFAPGLFGATARMQPDVILCMGRMANCYAGGLQVQHPRAVVVATMRTGKNLPWLFRRSLRLARHIVANSRDARHTLVNAHDLPPAKISVIYNSLVFPGAGHVGGVPPPRGLELRAHHGATPTTTVLLCVAMLRPEKNQRELIEIAGGLPPEIDWQLWLAGDGPARSACEQLVAARNLGARVKFLGFQRDPSALYATADIAVHASASEALSNFLIEAQAHGLPAVAYAAQGIAECFKAGRTGFLIPRDERDGFRSALSQLVALSPPERAALAEDARFFARTAFDPQQQVAAYLELFQKLIVPSPSS